MRLPCILAESVTADLPVNQDTQHRNNMKYLFFMIYIQIMFNIASLCPSFSNPT